MFDEHSREAGDRILRFADQMGAGTQKSAARKGGGDQNVGQSNSLR
ncbi:hypothetical protein [Pseudochelatococcus sp. G4_1912]